MREKNMETRMEDALKVGQHTLESLRTAQMKLENVRKLEMRERFGGNIFISIMKNVQVIIYFIILFYFLLHL